LLVLAGFLVAGSIFVEGRQYFHPRVVFEVEIIQHCSGVKEKLGNLWHLKTVLFFLIFNIVNQFITSMDMSLNSGKLGYILLVVLVGGEGIVKLMSLFN